VYCLTRGLTKQYSWWSKRNLSGTSVYLEPIWNRNLYESKSITSLVAPNRQITEKRVWEVLEELDLAAEVREVRVDPPFAIQGFLGSPTVHVNGIDIEPSARTSKWMGLMWRTYREGSQMSSAPSKKLIRQAILDAGDSLSKTANH
jgi:hypothetical protein